MEMLGKSIFDDQSICIGIKDGLVYSIEEIPHSNELPYLSPGFLDMQVNGYRKIDYSLPVLSIEDIAQLIQYLGESGPTKHIPTFVAVSHICLLRNLKTVRRAMKNDLQTIAAIEGLHIEGPFISSEDGPKGAHDPTYVVKPLFEPFREWQEAADDQIKHVILAPERTGALDLIERLVSTGVRRVAIGHTGTDSGRIREAIAAGTAISAHLGNGSHSMIPRLSNYIWEQLAADGLWAEMISDRFHLPPAVVVIVFTRIKGLERIVLVSDVASLDGLEAGEYK